MPSRQYRVLRTLIALVVISTACPYAAKGADLPDVPDMWRFATDSGDVGLQQKWYSLRHEDGDWTTIKIGQGWEKAGFDYDGVAWYRVRMTLPERAGRQGAAAEVRSG